MNAQAKLRMSADEFIAWALDRPEGQRYELAAGEVVAMSPERVGHTRVKQAVWRALRDAVEEANLDCEALMDGPCVRVDDSTVYEPDALVRCGARTSDEAVEVADPIVLVEVISPSSRSRDTGAKLDDYFRIGSVRHYLIVKLENRAVIHHCRDEDGTIRTRIVQSGRLLLDPPGLSLDVAQFFQG